MPTLPPPLPPVCDLRVDADDAAARVEQRAAGVAGVDRGVGLQDVADREAVLQRRDLALQRREMTPVVSVRSRPNGLPIATVGSPTCDVLGRAELERVQVEAVGIDEQQREVGRRVARRRPSRVAIFVVGERDASRAWRRRRRGRW